MLHNANMDQADIRSGNLLRAWREHRKMTQEQLAAKVETTGAVISLLESGDRKLSPKWLYRLAPALETRPGWLLDYHPDDIPTDIMEIWGEIPEPDRQLARDVLLPFRHRRVNE